MANGSDEVRVDVVGVFEQWAVVPDREERLPLLVLRDARDRELRVPIASCEGLAIHIALEDRFLARPLTHDLALRLLEKLSAEVSRVVIDDLRDDSYHSRIHLDSASGDIALEAEPGDAVALALRAEAPVYVTEDVLARAGRARGESA